MGNDNLKNESNNANTVLCADWRKVEDSMPEDVTAVLVYGWCCDVCWHIKIAEIEKGEWWESGTGEDLVFKPTHWMPLPLPPICT